MRRANDCDSRSDSSEDEEFQEDLQRLRDYSLTSISVYQTTFDMHGLIQLATRDWLKSHE